MTEWVKIVLDLAFVVASTVLFRRAARQGAQRLAAAKEAGRLVMVWIGIMLILAIGFFLLTVLA